jgi:hypothetical protein
MIWLEYFLIFFISTAAAVVRSAPTTMFTLCNNESRQIKGNKQTNRALRDSLPSAYFSPSLETTHLFMLAKKCQHWQVFLSLFPSLSPFSMAFLKTCFYLNSDTNKISYFRSLKCSTTTAVVNTELLLLHRKDCCFEFARIKKKCMQFLLRYSWLQA